MTTTFHHRAMFKFECPLSRHLPQDSYRISVFVVHKKTMVWFMVYGGMFVYNVAVYHVGIFAEKRDVLIGVDCSQLLFISHLSSGA